jgi:hypothetical protein
VSAEGGRGAPKCRSSTFSECSDVLLAWGAEEVAEYLHPLVCQCKSTALQIRERQTWVQIEHLCYLGFVQFRFRTEPQRGLCAPPGLLGRARARRASTRVAPRRRIRMWRRARPWWGRRRARRDIERGQRFPIRVGHNFIEVDGNSERDKMLSSDAGARPVRRSCHRRRRHVEKRLV